MTRREDLHDERVQYPVFSKRNSSSRTEIAEQGPGLPAHESPENMTAYHGTLSHYARGYEKTCSCRGQVGHVGKNCSAATGMRYQEPSPEGRAQVDGGKTRSTNFSDLAHFNPTPSLSSLNHEKRLSTASSRRSQEQLETGLEFGNAFHNQHVLRRLSKPDDWFSESRTPIRFSDRDAEGASCTATDTPAQVARESETVQVTLRRKRKGRKGRPSMYDLTPHVFY